MAFISSVIPAWLEHRFQRRWANWLERRLPRRKSVRLGHRSIFIVPSAAGWVFGLLLVLLLVTAINYQNSLIYGLAFWLFGIGGSALYLTFRNLAGLELSVHEPLPCYVGEFASVPLRLTLDGKVPRYAVTLGYPGTPAQCVDVAAGQVREIQLAVECVRRGRLQPGRVLIETRFPIGLFRAWSWIDLDVGSLVYPRQLPTPLVTAADGQGGELPGASVDLAGQQDFRGLRPYQAGDSLKQIAWKQLARGKGLVTKEFDRDEGASCWLDWANTSGDIETRLSKLCGWVLHCHEQGWLYGLRLPGVEIRPAFSELHLKQCLRALALFGERDNG